MSKYREGDEKLVAVIGDEDTITGFLLAGVAEMNRKNEPNYLMVDSETSPSEIQQAFKKFTSRKDIAILLINQDIADDIRDLLQSYNRIIPAILEIPSANSKYDPDKDYILQRVKAMFGES
eukprot:gb/GECH01012367.1/.p1 GENE.gb/GECH01012367.1/~~gb/GECH01012367.1/.p1  ORF type:complete len:121 (+),score=30.90 gb/GECH01012367.1/:1-363(+)